ncbi:MAG: phosphate acyltransferase PlsX, partial [Victivallaceae bacterium]|nr:phosphate acyltransferase PlsX [Victivallaceae bacterium]
MKIAVDAMGGDFAPGAVVEGAATALFDFPECQLVLVGHAGKLKFYLEKYGISNHPRIEVVHAETVVEMCEHSTAALRAKKDSSITVCAKLMKEGKVQAVVTPGHTGAAVAAMKVLVRTLPGVDRPALAALMPGQGFDFLLTDAGANTDCTPLNLVQFAVMGEVYAQFLFGESEPAVGLLSVGGEDVKGNDLTKSVFKHLAALKMNFTGNVEANTVYEGGTRVLVCDGFTGNVFLKCAEGLAKSVIHWFKHSVLGNPLRMTGAALVKSAFLEVKARGSAEQAGGAPLLGINGICIIGHGTSSPLAVRNAIKVAAEC